MDASQQRIEPPEEKQQFARGFDGGCLLAGLAISAFRIVWLTLAG